MHLSSPRQSSPRPRQTAATTAGAQHQPCLCQPWPSQAAPEQGTLAEDAPLVGDAMRGNRSPPGVHALTLQAAERRWLN